MPFRQYPPYRFFINSIVDTGWCETQSIAWTNDPDINLYEQSWRSRSGHAATLLWAETPDRDEEEDDPYHRELDMPGFR